MKHTIFLLALICSLSSCEDFFETTLELDPPPFVKQLVIDCTVGSGQDSVFVSISHNEGILQLDTYAKELLVNDAVVLLTVNGATFQASAYTSNFINFENYNNYVVVLPTGLAPTDIIGISASHPDYGEAKSQVIMPDISEVISTSFIENGGLDTDGDERSKVTISIKDAPGTHFYSVKVIAPGYDSTPRLTYISSIDPSISETYNSYELVVEDSSFDGKEKLLEFQMYRISEEEAQGNIFIVWREVSSSYYQYSKSLKAYNEISDNPFASPISLYSNIESGLGIFSVFNERVIEVK